ncbi:hypothetical protein B5181_11895 [Streptomyces sp. 4F]|nr:hypothetical protein B5181_11895 [Streptomyces sp. 4F]
MAGEFEPGGGLEVEHQRAPGAPADDQEASVVADRECRGSVVLQVQFLAALARGQVPDPQPAGTVRRVAERARESSSSTRSASVITPVRQRCSPRL